MSDPRPPHDYVPAGPLDFPPPGGFEPASVRGSAFDAVLEGVPLGEYDRQVIEWLANLDDPACQTVASIMWRCRLAGPPAASPQDPDEDDDAPAGRPRFVVRKEPRF